MSRSSSGDLVSTELGVRESRIASQTPGSSSYCFSTHWYGSVLVPSATCSRFQDGRINSARSDLRRVDLDDDLALEVPAGVEVQVGVGGPSKAVSAGMRAAAIRVDRPAERHPRCLGHPVQDRLRADLVEADVQRLGGVEGPDHRRLAVAGEASAVLAVTFRLSQRTNTCSHIHRLGFQPVNGPDSSARRQAISVTAALTYAPRAAAISSSRSAM